MHVNLLNSKDYDKMLEFFYSLHEEEKDFRRTTLDLLLKFYNFNIAAFLLADTEYFLTKPVGVNISDSLIRNYNDYYHKTDIFQNIYSNKKVLSITDIMSYSEYEKTEYYNDFLKKENLYYQVAMPLKFKNELIGGIGIHKEKKEENFTEKELMILNRINDLISYKLNLNLRKARLKKEYQLSKKCYSNLPIGVIILDNNFEVIDFNEASKEICNYISESYDCGEGFECIINLIFSRVTKSRLNSNNTIFIPLESYNIELIPIFITNMYDELERFFYLYITNIETEKIVKLEKARRKYNLTKRESEVVDLVLEGLRNKEIADKLHVSPHTIKTHIENIFKKMEINNRVLINHKVQQIK
ncbi:LuxR C-terminal-related transcriptional regulator [Wukongibacter baidiensis]|uniref:LuxR C-terminal-related transcriptional regulator n=1 Tax=Wukongibacter baidiensis TaxID=1723361 RepID=UPI003D7F1BA2